MVQIGRFEESHWLRYLESYDPKGYTNKDDLLMDSIILGACFTPISGIQLLAIDGTRILIPIMAFSLLSLEMKKVWLRVILVLAQVRKQLDLPSNETITFTVDQRRRRMQSMASAR